MRPKLRVDGFVVLGPNGMFPGTFSPELEPAIKIAVTVAFLNSYKSVDVRVSEASLIRTNNSETWPIPEKESKRVDAAFARSRRRRCDS